MQPLSAFRQATAYDILIDTPVIGYVRTQYVRCGKANCRCLEGHLHGPYYYRVWHHGLVTRKEYIPPEDVERVRHACALSSELKADLRASGKSVRHSSEPLGLSSIS